MSRNAKTAGFTGRLHEAEHGLYMDVQSDRKKWRNTL